MKKETILLTGTLGFIGSNFVRNIIPKYPQFNFIGIDKAVAEYNLDNMFSNQNYQFFLGDITDEHFINNVFKLNKIDYIINMAAESFVDASIKNAKEFVFSNIYGTQILIDAALKYDIKKFCQTSTDEVYGQLKVGDKSWTEEEKVAPRNPYSASKAGAELLLFASSETHKLKYNITRCANNYGAFQPPRNLVPKIITCLMEDKEIPIAGSGEQIREWIAAEDHCSAMMTVLLKGKDNQIYNVGSGMEMTNLEMVAKIAKMMNKGPKIKFVKDRPAHDQRYSVNCSKLKSLGWMPSLSFEDGMQKCINWYLKNKN